VKSFYFRKAIQWLGILVLAHVVAMILFGLFLSSYVTNLVIEEIYSEAYVTVFGFCLVFDILFCIAYFKIETSFISYRKELKESIRSGNFTLIGNFKEKKLKEYIIRISVFVLFQIPFLLFFSFFGLSFTATTGFERFYIMDAGAYALTRIPILGFTLNTLIFSAIYLGAQLLFSFLTERSLKKEMI